MATAVKQSIMTRSSLKQCRHCHICLSAAGQLTATVPPSAGSANAASEWCTGAMISARHVLTAAHCVWDVEASHAAMQNIKFAPDFNGGAPPYGDIAYEAVRPSVAANAFHMCLTYQIAELQHDADSQSCML